MARKVLLFVFMLAAVFAFAACGGGETIQEREVAPEEIYVEITAEATLTANMPSFTIHTNLPSHTSLMLTLTGEDGFSGQSNITIFRGTGSSNMFGSIDNPRHGSHTLTVSMSMARFPAESVQALIGEQGEYMHGDLVNVSQFGEHTISVDFEFYFD